MQSEKSDCLFDPKESDGKNDLYEIVLDETGVAVFELKIKTREVFYSSSCSKYALFNESLDDIINNTADITTVYSEDLPVLQQFFKDTKSKKHRAQVELRLKLTDGTFRWSRITGIMLSDAQGNPERTIGIVSDIHKEKNEAFEKDEMINAIPTGIGVFEVNGNETKVVYMNDGFYRLMEDEREKRDERTNGVFMNSIHPKDRLKVGTAIKSVIDGENSVSVICRSQKGDGTYKWLRFSSSVAKRDGDYILVYSTYSSMEEEMNIRKEMDKNKVLLETAITSADMSVWEYDCENHHIIQTDSSMSKHGFNKIIENVPQSLIECGYVHENSVGAYKKLYRDALSLQQVTQGDYYVKTKDGKGYWWEHIILTPVFGDSGKMTKLLGVSLDVTDRKEKEEQYYRQIGVMSESNEKNLIAKAQYNLSRGELIYYAAMRGDAVTIKPDESFKEVLLRIVPVVSSAQERKKMMADIDANRLLELFANGITEGSYEYKRKFPGYPMMYAHTKYLMSADPTTGDVMLFFYCYDDTENRLQHIMIDSLSQREYESFGIIDVKTGDFAQTGSAYSDSHMSTGHNYMMHCAEIVNKYVLPSDRIKMTQNLNMENIVSHLDKNGMYAFHFSVSEKNRVRLKKLLFRYTDNTKETILFASSDITELYLQEQEQLVKTQKALAVAEKATKAKTDFLSRMSHDIRTPLNAILGTAALAKDELNNPDTLREYIDTITSSGQFLLGLINDILDISKIESGKIELRPEVCKVSDFENSIETAIRPLMDAKHIDFTFSMGCGYKKIVVDKLRHHQIFFNLLSNAAKYTPEYGHVEYITERIEAPDGMAGVRNIVRDNGIGMTKEYMEHLFEPFSRDTNAEINQIEGSGLGLAIVNNIVKTMNGTISVKSELGKGTEFIVDLFMPLPTESLMPEDDKKIYDEKTLEGKNILLVEDNAINVAIAKKLLEKKGCVITLCSNGQEAVDTFRNSQDNKFDAVLMDIRMPVMNGIDAAIAIRALPRDDAQTIPIIAMTADAFNEDVNKTAAAGMNAHMSKPVEPEKLYKTLIGLLS